jgi:hypothetical protein
VSIRGPEFFAAMVVVIADDFSGAAELADIAVRAGLRAELQMDFAPDSDADVLCIDADTRSLSSDAAAARFAEMGRVLAAVRPALVFKKCDSVLRGHIAAESRALAAALGKKRVLLVPANPSRGRVIRDGTYFVNGVPLAETAFAADPEHPRRTSRVGELLGDACGLECPDVPDAATVAALAQTVDGDTLPVGAADFFAALLPRSRGALAPSVPDGAGAPRLLVCGSAAAWLGGRREQCTRHGVPIAAMPQALFAREQRDDLLARWAEHAARALADRGAAMVAIGGDEPHPGVTPRDAHRAARRSRRTRPRANILRPGAARRRRHRRDRAAAARPAPLPRAAFTGSGCRSVRAARRRRPRLPCQARELRLARGGVGLISQSYPNV